MDKHEHLMGKDEQARHYRNLLVHGGQIEKARKERASIHAQYEEVRARLKAKDEEIGNLISEHMDLMYRRGDFAQFDLEFDASRDMNPDGWKTLGVDALDIKSSRIRVLKDIGVDTLAKLSELMADGRLHGIKGINEAGEAEIVEAFEQFWIAHPEYLRNKKPGSDTDAGTE